MKIFFDEIDLKGDDIVFLVEEEGNRVWVDWVVLNVRKKVVGILKFYLISF